MRETSALTPPAPWSVRTTSTNISPCTSSSLLAAVSGNHRSSPARTAQETHTHTHTYTPPSPPPPPPPDIPRGDLSILSLSSITLPSGSFDLLVGDSNHQTLSLPPTQAQYSHSNHQTLSLSPQHRHSIAIATIKLSLSPPNTGTV